MVCPYGPNAVWPYNAPAKWHTRTRSAVAPWLLWLVTVLPRAAGPWPDGSYRFRLQGGALTAGAEQRTTLMGAGSATTTRSEGRRVCGGLAQSEFNSVTQVMPRDLLSGGRRKRVRNM
jgi:hypothetical protein